MTDSIRVYKRRAKNASISQEWYTPTNSLLGWYSQAFHDMKISIFRSLLFFLTYRLKESSLQLLPDSKGRVAIAELEPNEIVPRSATEFKTWSRLLASDDTALHFKCTKDNKRIAGSADGRFRWLLPASCPANIFLVVSSLASNCCRQGHELAGNARVDYTCCLKGFMYDGSICKVDPGYNGGGGQQQQLHLQHQQQQQGGRGAESQQQQQQQQQND